MESSTVTLAAKPRTGRGKGPSRRLRAEGLVPTVSYGSGDENRTLAVSSHALSAILLSERGRNTVIQLSVDGGESWPVMVKAYDVHPLSRQLIHADFVRIDPTKPIEVEVPFYTTGKSKGENEGGTLLVATRMFPVRCLPHLIPGYLEHDVSELNINDDVRVRELKFPEGVEPMLGPNTKVVMVKPPRVEVEETPAVVEGAVPAEGAEGAEGAAAAPAAEAEEKE